MEHMADVHRSIVADAGKLTGERFKSQVAFVIEIWEKWQVFFSVFLRMVERQAHNSDHVQTGSCLRRM